MSTNFMKLNEIFVSSLHTLAVHWPPVGQENQAPTQLYQRTPSMETNWDFDILENYALSLTPISDSVAEFLFLSLSPFNFVDSRDRRGNSWKAS
jgi:hypothetical protein